MNIFEAVKTNVTAKQAAEYYGIKVGRNGMAICPFHPDHHPSMKVDRRFHCFGCQADGDVIDFTARLYGLSNYEAAKKLADDFSVEYDASRGHGKRKAQKSETWRGRNSHGPPGKDHVRKRKQGKPPEPRQKTKVLLQKSPEEIFEEAERKCFRIYADYLHLLEEWKEQFAPRSPDDEWHPRFCEALEKQTYVEYLLDTLLYGTLEEKMHLICEKRKEVTDLERKMERYAAGAAGGDLKGSAGDDSGGSAAAAAAISGAGTAALAG